MSVHIEGVETQPRPIPHKYTIGTCLRFPVRLLTPVPPSGAVKVRTCGVVPPLEIQLNDVLNGKHLPPLSALDFEEYLRYQEQSVENLFFLRWLNDYTKKFEATEGSDKPSKPYGLALSYSRARSTYLDNGSPLCLNISPKNRPIVPASFMYSYPNPSAFDGARAEVEGQLRQSLSTFIQSHALGNAGMIQRTFSFTGGVLTVLIALIPILYQILLGEQRHVDKSVRLACIPFFWLGFIFIVTPLKGVCAIVWLFGEGRQLRGYELARPRISNPLEHSRTCATQLQKSGTMSSDGRTLGDHLDLMESGFPTSKDESGQRSSSSQKNGSRSFTDSSSSPRGQFDPKAAAASPPAVRDLSSLEPSSNASPSTPYVLDFDDSPASTSSLPDVKPDRPHCPRTLKQIVLDAFSAVLGCREVDQLKHDGQDKAIPRPGLWGPLTRIHNADILRRNREIMVFAVSLSSILTAVLTGALWTVATRPARM